MSDATACFECHTIILAGADRAGGRFLPQCLDCALKEARGQAQQFKQQYMSAQTYLDDLEKRRAAALRAGAETEAGGG